MQIESDAISYIYEKFEGTTWYIQKICNELYAMAEQNHPCGIKDVDVAINYAIEEKKTTPIKTYWQDSLPNKKHCSSLWPTLVRMPSQQVENS